MLCAARLLHRMRQLVRQHAPSRIGFRRVLRITERDVIADRVCQRVYCARRPRRGRIVMHSHVAEIFSEAHLEKCARRSIERTSARCDHVIYDRWNRAARLRIGRRALQFSVLRARLARIRPDDADDSIILNSRWLPIGAEDLLCAGRCRDAGAFESCVFDDLRFGSLIASIDLTPARDES